MKAFKHGIVSILILLAIWQLIFQFGGFNQALFPSPAKALSALVELCGSGQLFAHIWASMYRFFIGYVIAAIVGIGLGLILGWFHKIFAYVNPIIQILRPISPVAWLPFIVLWFGIGDVPTIVIIFIAGFFPILLSTAAGVFQVDPLYLKVAKNYGISRSRTLIKIVFPAAFPQIISGLHLAIGTAWIFLVAGEMIGAQSGLGFLVVDSRNNLRMDYLLATIITIGLIGFILDSIIKVVEKRIMMRWGV